MPAAVAGHRPTTAATPGGGRAWTDPDGACRAGSLEEVRFTDIEHLEFDLQTPDAPRAPTSPSGARSRELPRVS